MTSFDGLAEAYDAGRPDYPEAVFDALEPLGGELVLEGGAGTGIATRALARRGARVVPFDIGHVVLAKAVPRSPQLAAVVANGGAMPFRDGCADLLCFAQSWHWLDPERRCPEAARVLKRQGRWAAWWSHARADGHRWFEAYWEALEASTVARREERDVDWGQELRRSGLFDVDDRRSIAWTRDLTIERWLIDETSKSYVASLPEDEKEALVARIERLCREHFPGGSMVIPYETWLWVAIKT